MEFRLSKDTSINDAKPFLKWAGGKNQLIKEIKRYLPSNINEIETYIEPFVGSGAVMFWMIKNFPNIKEAIINDVNTDLINTYNVIKCNPKLLIETLEVFQNKYLSLNEIQRKDYFLEQRYNYNFESSDVIVKSALFIFLNKTSFNGLYRVNSKNKFNVPFGKYNNPNICDSKTILSDSKLLQNVTILNSDYTGIENYISEKTLVYFDPPYKPISKTSSFNSYSFEVFDDNEQIRLFNFCKRLDGKNVKWLLSNSDPKNVDEHNDFFDILYNQFNIYRVQAKRFINSDASKRGSINELIITNYRN